MNEETRIKLRETRRLMMADLEKLMLKGKTPEDIILYYHSSEDCIVLSHALFWVMIKSLKRKVAKGRTSSFSVRTRRKRSFNLTRW